MIDLPVNAEDQEEGGDEEREEGEEIEEEAQQVVPEVNAGSKNREDEADSWSSGENGRDNVLTD